MASNTTAAVSSRPVPGVTIAIRLKHAPARRHRYATLGCSRTSTYSPQSLYSKYLAAQAGPQLKQPRALVDLAAPTEFDRNPGLIIACVFATAAGVILPFEK